jgi:hypothetical protein
MGQIKFHKHYLHNSMQQRPFETSVGQIITEPEGSLPYSQQPTTRSYREPDESSLRPPILFH